MVRGLTLHTGCMLLEEDSCLQNCQSSLGHRRTFLRHLTGVTNTVKRQVETPQIQ